MHHMAGGQHASPVKPGPPHWAYFTFAQDGVGEGVVTGTGAEVGAAVGASVGAGVGSLVGNGAGAAVGAAVGASVGTSAGPDVGSVPGLPTAHDSSRHEQSMSEVPEMGTLQDAAL